MILQTFFVYISFNQKYCKSLKMVEILLIFKTASDSNMRLKRGDEAGRRGEAGWKGEGILTFLPIIAFRQSKWFMVRNLVFKKVI